MFSSSKLILVHFLLVQTNILGSNGTSEQCCTEGYSSTANFSGTGSSSFIESFIAKRALRNVDMNKLIRNYSLICPVQHSCGADIDERFLYDGELSAELTNCRTCKCGRACLFDGNCCPGSHFGYVEHQCVNIIMFPKDENETYNMVVSCPNVLDLNATIVEKCTSKVEPCIGTESGLIYKNKYCSQCNQESMCIKWPLNVECETLQENMNSFTSLLQLKEALEEGNCRIAFSLPDNEAEIPCLKKRNNIHQTFLIEKCNVSGLWDIYDADIEWACENFINPYKEFKNVFCYICNPSVSKENDVLVDTCSISRTDDTISKTHNACLSFPVSSRLAPYKNIYCYVCNQGYTELFTRSNDEFYLKDAAETFDMDINSTVNITIGFVDKHSPNDVRELLSDLLKNHHLENGQTMLSSGLDKVKYERNDFKEIQRSYTAVCGTTTLCHIGAHEHTSNTSYGNPVCGECSCTKSCAGNTDCCLDILINRQPYSCYSPSMFPSFHNSEDTQRSHIYHGDKTTDLYMTVDRCIKEEDESIPNQSCSLYNYTDYLSQVPVVTDSGVTHKNIYCFGCNSNTSAVSVMFQADCTSYIEYKLFRTARDLLNAIKLYCHQISFVPYKSLTCLQEYDTFKAGRREGKTFIRKKQHPSQFEFRITTYEDVNITQFNAQVKNVFDKCNKTGFWNEENKLVRNVCESTDVNIMLLPEYRIENNVYKNFACFRCNPDVDTSNIDNTTVISNCLLNTSIEWYEPNGNLELKCKLAKFEQRWFPYKNLYCFECNLPPLQLVDVKLLIKAHMPAAAYNYIFTMSLMDFEHLDTVEEKEVIPDCKEGTYDYSLKQCRPLSCNNGFQLHNNVCKPLLESASNHKYNIEFSLHHTNDYSYDKNESIIVRLFDICMRIVENVTYAFGEGTKYTIGQIDCKASSGCISLESNNVFQETFVDIVRTKSYEIYFSVGIMYTESVTVVHTALVGALKQQFHLRDIPDIYGKNLSILLHSNPSYDKGVDALLFFPCFNSKTFIDIKTAVVKFRKFKIDQFFICGQVRLNSSAVNFNLSSKTIELKHTNVTFNEDEYKYVNQTVIVCADDFSRKTYKEAETVVVTRTEPIKSTLIVYSLVCTTISLLCLFLTFVTYTLISSLRTIAGMNIMSLCVCLFSSQALLQFGINITKQTTACSIIGIFIHFSWLASFCAMNVCSFHTFKVFYYTNVSRGLSESHSIKTLFLKYLSYIICFPTVFVLSTVFMSLAMSDFSDTGYGEYYCFISNFHIFLLTFITPACVIFFSNIVFFAVAFHKIRTAPTMQRTQERNNFYICLRLCTIVGVAWPLLIIDNTFKISWFSFVVAGVNSLQGPSVQIQVFNFITWKMNRLTIFRFVCLIGTVVAMKRCKMPTEEEYNILLKLTTSTSKHRAYDVPVSERTKLEKAVLRKFQRFRDSYSVSNNKLYFCNKEVLTMDKCKHIIHKSFKKSKGLGVRRLYYKLNPKYSGISERLVRKVLLTLPEYRKSAVRFNNKVPLKHIISNSVHETLQVDLVDMSRDSVMFQNQKCKYILSVMDVFSRFVWLRPIKSKSAEEVAKHLSNIFVEFGNPKVIQHDRGREFDGDVKRLLSNLNIKNIKSRPYHPQSQGKVERMHKTLKKKIAYDFANANPCGVNWAKQLSEYQRILNNDPKECLGWRSPHEVYYGRDDNYRKDNLTNPTNAKHIRDKAKAATIKCNNRNDKRHNTNCTTVYNIGDPVHIRYKKLGALNRKVWVLDGVVKNRSLKTHMYEVEFQPSDRSDKKLTKWFHISNVTQRLNGNPATKTFHCIDKEKYYIPYSSSSKLKELRHEFGLQISMNPLGNGNCQFSAIAHQLQGLGLYRSEKTLRQDVVQYLSQTYFLGTSNSQWWNSLTETRENYLRRMSLNFEYGDQLTLQGISELYNVQIIIVSTMNHGTTLIRPDGSSILTRDLPIITLGHYPEGGGEHYVALEYESNTIRRIIQESTQIYEENELSDDDTIQNDYAETSDMVNLQSDNSISDNENFDNGDAANLQSDSGIFHNDNIDNGDTANLQSDSGISHNDNIDNGDAANLQSDNGISDNGNIDNGDAVNLQSDNGIFDNDNFDNGCAANLQSDNGISHNDNIDNGDAANLQSDNGISHNDNIDNGDAANLQSDNGISHNDNIHNGDNGDATNLQIDNGISDNDSIDNGDAANLQSDNGISHNDNIDNGDAANLQSDNGISHNDNIDNGDTAKSENNDNGQHVYTQNLNNDVISLRSLVENMRHRRRPKSSFIFTNLPLLVQIKIVRYCLHENPASRYVLNRCHLSNVVHLSGIHLPRIYISPDIMQDVPNVVSVRRLILNFGRFSGLVIAIRNIIRESRWANAWLHLRACFDAIYWYDIVNIWYRRP